MKEFDGVDVEFSTFEAQKQAIAQANTILGYIPGKGISIEERSDCNVLVRNLVSRANDLTLVYLALERDHQLSRVELVKRLNENNFGLFPLLKMFEHVNLRDSSKGRCNLQRLGFKNLSNSSLSASPTEVVESLFIFSGGVLGEISTVLERVLSNRPDAERISCLTVEKVEKVKGKFFSQELITTIRQIKDRSKKI